tara:strand:+ start:478 stop:1269 length:792 start_codon:yes stop_codon:yes gene_type:complete
MDNKLSIVGGGKMGEALLTGLITSNWAQPEQISVIEPDEIRSAELQKKFPETVFSPELLTGKNFLLAVKPQTVETICKDISAMDPQRVLSIAAGVTTSSMENHLPSGTSVIRAMPNTPAMIGEGMSAIAPGMNTSKEDLDWASSILSAVGEVVVVHENKLDAVTGLSGSGPAYLFLLAEAMTAAGVANGLEESVADLLTRQTLFGASSLLSKSGIAPKDLRASVTSPNGTTAAAIGHLEANGFPALFNQAITKATERSKELGQ